jgi:hypothetical protein
MDQPGTDSVIGVIAPPQRHLQRHGDHRGVLHGGGVPAHDGPGEAVNHEPTQTKSDRVLQ